MSTITPPSDSATPSVRRPGEPMSFPPFHDASGLARLRDALLAPPVLAVAGGMPGGTLPGGRHRRSAAENSPHESMSVALSMAAGAAASGGVAGNVYGVPAPAAPADLGDPEARRVTALVDRAKTGDSEAFAQLYDRYVDTIHRYVYYRVGSRQLAEDLTSETFLRALRRIETFTWQGRDFGAWLVTIARNLIADHFKSSRFRLEVTTAEMVDTDHVEESPEGEVMANFANTALLEAVQRLNSQQQECLVLRFLQGLSVAETARIMGKNEGAIKTLQYRAIRALAALLPEDVR
jgi:RNA polymerase sigma-70 factor (ECF subfamily)